MMQETAFENLFSRPRANFKKSKYKNKTVKLADNLPTVTEYQESVLVFQWAQFNPVARQYLFAIPNGGSRHPAEAKKLKRQGVRKGVSDYFLPYPAKGKHGLWIELKTQNGRATKEQAEWLAQMADLGYAAKLARGAEEAIRAIEDYLKIG